MALKLFETKKGAAKARSTKDKIRDANAKVGDVGCIVVCLVRVSGCYYYNIQHTT